ncbi:ComEA family DNA-binding protein [Pseudoalteromonas sp. T1lg23B]|uniref:ComEA family DNA-binding protein n=1 Tax=Pseudoalteromonas sp. T1lg23B TaxID=2077097 RepID=UPI001F39637B|nr:ComEA family DNA-binding protein [Pseudoalteromonas sp. T1lg23B]
MMKSIILVVTLIMGFGLNHNAGAQELNQSASVKVVEPTTHLVDINSASVDELAKLPGVGQKKAQAIIDYRQTNGRFVDFDGLQQVKGIGSRIAAKLEGKIRF